MKTLHLKVKNLIKINLNANLEYNSHSEQLHSVDILSIVFANVIMSLYENLSKNIVVLFNLYSDIISPSSCIFSNFKSYFHLESFAI